MNTKKHEFDAVIQKVEDINSAYIDIPYDVQEKSTKKSQKQTLRTQMLARRDSEPSENRLKNSRSIHERLFAQEFYQKAKCVYCYVSFRSEVDTKDLLKKILDDGKRLFVPRVEKVGEHVSDRKMQFYEIISLTDLIPGTFGILEPDPEKCIHSEEYPSGLMLLPGSVFDRSGRRIGYGGGYYDRYLAECPQFYKAALAFACQLCDEIPQEETDIRMDAIVTELQIYVW